MAEREGQLQIEVADNGPGIPPEIQIRLFEPFVTYGKSQGTGLGLAIVRQIVESHDGTLTVESTSAETGGAKPAISTAGKGIGRKSQCEPLAEVIMAKVEVGLSAQRIYQDLVEENGFTDSYQSVKRFVRKLRSIQRFLRSLPWT